MSRDILETSMGYNGAEFISDTVLHSATGCVFTSLQVISDIVIASYTTQAPITGNTLVGVPISAGTVLHGRFTGITLTSGQLLAYKGM